MARGDASVLVLVDIEGALVSGAVVGSAASGVEGGCVETGSGIDVGGNGVGIGVGTFGDGAAGTCGHESFWTGKPWQMRTQENFSIVESKQYSQPRAQQSAQPVAAEHASASHVSLCEVAGGQSAAAFVHDEP